MVPPLLPPTLVFHRAALGDTILIWPFLRTLGHAALISDLAKARLCARFLPHIVPLEIETARWNSLWSLHDPVSPGEADPAVTRIVSFIAPCDSSWARNVRRLFPHADLQFLPTKPPIRMGDLHTPFRDPTSNPSSHAGAIFHLGAGSHSKRWSFSRSFDFVRRCRAHLPINLLAGPVEMEQMSADDRETFTLLGGAVPNILDDLVDLLNASSLFIGFDSGPTHLAGALGVPTMVLFGPTDPSLWRPNGRDVRVLAPPAMAVDMGWLSPEEVVSWVMGRAGERQSSIREP